MENYNNLLSKKEYAFLSKFNLAYLTLGGSRAYGTNIESSDVDIRGVFFESKNELYSIKKAQDIFVETNTDTALYPFKKIISLLIKCNPNIIELLGTRDKDKLYISPVGQRLLDNKNLFLSKIAYASFSGYATAQLRRLENALARDTYTLDEKEKHILESIRAEMLLADNTFKDFDKNSIYTLYLDNKYDNSDLLPQEQNEEIYINCSLKGVPIREFLKRNSNIENTIKNYGKLTKRNNKKDVAHLNKHAMHLIRLYLMCLDILKNGEIITYRSGKEHDLLMAIRNGEMSYNEVFKMANEYSKKIKDAYLFSALPEQPNIDEIDKFVIETYKMFL